MAYNFHKLLRTDPYVAVVYRDLLRNLEFYETLRVQGVTHDRLRQHKTDLRWLLEELQWSSRKSAKWTRGQEQLTDFVELRNELKIYQIEVFEGKTIQESENLYATKHQVFYAVLQSLRRLFAA